tara:strand:- start:922 stop:2766 length:1845 start_codon:yes stop_codon:yes gene_type:complete
MANIKVKLTLLTAGGSSGPLYNAYYTTDGTTYIIAVDGSNVTLASVGSEVIVTVPDNSTNIKLVNLTVGCQDNYYVVPVVTTTTTTTLIPLSGNGTYTCASPCGSNGTFTIQNISGGIGPPYQTAFFASGDTPVWNNYPQVSAYGNLFVGCPVPLTYTFGVRTSNGYTVYLDSTLCTTTTLAPSTVTITALNGLDVNSFTVYINGVADTGWKSGSRTYASGTVINVTYNSNACGVTKNGSAYASNTNVTLSGGVAQSFSLNNYNSWTDTGYYPCQGNIQYKEQINPCGQYQTVPRYSPPSTCDCACNQNCSGTSYGPNECRGQDLVQYEFYNCSGNPTGSYQVVQSCSCSCDYSACGTTYYTAEYCGQPGRVGTNPSSRYRDQYYTCGPYITTETISNCSCSCDQTCLGEYWGAYYCVEGQSGVKRRDKKYTCNNANTGVSETTTCNQDCGAFVAPIWTPVGDPTCDGCYQSQEEVQSNVCCPDPPQGTTRPVELGPNTECGIWNLEYYCVNPGYQKWSRLRNSCVDVTCCDTFIEADSTYCGYVPPQPCRTYQIVGDYENESVNGIYTNCAGGSDSFSFFGGPGTVGYICAQISTVYVTSGNGYATDTGSTCT